MRAGQLLLVFIILILAFFSMGSVNANPTNGTSTITLSDAPPPGFENLDTETETVIDVYYGGIFLGSYTAKYSSTEVTFDNPTQIVKKLNNIEDISAITKALTGSLATHSNLLCQSSYQQDCGVLRPKVAGIIFDPNKFRADIFVNPSLVRENSKTSAQILGASDAGFSYLNSINTTYTGTDRNNSYNINSQNIFAYHEARLNGDISYAHNFGTDIEQTQINNLNASYNYGRYQVAVGSLTTYSDSLIPTENILGVSWETVSDALQDTGNVYGTPLQVFLPIPSKVSVFREGRLIGSGFYQAGKQYIDTNNFPDGAYTVVIRIEGQNGSVIQEEQPFVKTAQIPPLEYPTYFMNAGYIEKNIFGQTTLPEYSTTLLFQAGLIKRFKPNWGYNAMVVGESKNQFASTGLFFINKYLQVNPDVMVGNHGEYGYGVNAQVTVNDWFATVYGNHIKAHYQPSNVTEDQNLPDSEDDFSPIVGDSTTGGANISHSFGHVNVNVSGSINKRTNQDTFYSYGPTVRFPIYTHNGLNVNLETSITETQDDTVYMATFRAYLRPTSSHWSHTFNLGYQQFADRRSNATDAGDSSGVIGSESSIWQKLNAAQEGIKAGVNANVTPDTTAYGLTGAYDWRYGSLTADVQRNLNRTNSQPDNTQYSASITTQFAITPKLVAIGGERFGQTGIIVDVKSAEPSNDKFEVLVDNQVRKVIGVNSPTPILLQPFETYNVRIRAVGESLFDYKETPEHVTLYRGNLVPLVWEARQKVVLFTRVLDARGRPLRNRLILGGIGLNQTDADGSLQVELASTVKTLTARLAGKRTCKIQLPDYKIKDGIAILPDLRCR